MNMLQKVLSRVRKAAADYDMIQDGDKIAVGVSGGKDSQLLLIAMRELQRFLPVRFDLMGISINLGFEKFDIGSLLNFYQNSGVEYHVEETISLRSSLTPAKNKTLAPSVPT